MNDQRVLRVAEVRDGNMPRLESDFYIPLQISWVAPVLRPGPLPVYLRVSGLAGGELEFDIDRVTGDLLEVTVILLGAIVSEPTPAYPPVPLGHGCGVVVDRGLWEGVRENVIYTEWLLRPYRLPDGLRIDVAGVELVRLIQCGPRLTIGVDADGVFASLTARIDIDARHFQS